jgi:hypothetical protein
VFGLRLEFRRRVISKRNLFDPHFALLLDFTAPVARMGLMGRIGARDYSQSFYSRII